MSGIASPTKEEQMEVTINNLQEELKIAKENQHHLRKNLNRLWALVFILDFAFLVFFALYLRAIS